MSDTAEPPPPPSVANWVLSVFGVLGSIAVFLLVMLAARTMSNPKTTVDAQIAADRVNKLLDVQAKESDLYNNYSWVNQEKKQVRIPVLAAMKLMAEKLGNETATMPPPPVRFSLAYSPVAQTPPPPASLLVVPPPPPPAGTAPAPAGTAAPAAGEAAPAAAPAPTPAPTPAVQAPTPAANIQQPPAQVAAQTPPATQVPINAALPQFPTADEMTQINGQMKKLLIEQDPSAQAIFDRNPDYTPLNTFGGFNRGAGAGAGAGAGFRGAGAAGAGAGNGAGAQPLPGAGAPAP